MSQAAISAPTCAIRRATAPSLSGDFDVAPWDRADVVHVSNYHKRGTEHRPIVRAKVLYDDAGLYARFHVQDRYVYSVHTKYQDPVCRDSCVEFFVQPSPGPGYFNFETNCGGTQLLYYIEDPSRIPGRVFAKYVEVSPEHAKLIRVIHTMPPTVNPEIAEPTTWQVGFFVPYELFEAYAGSVRPVSGKTWRGNFYKCADKCSHPHWGMWSVVADPLSYHKPEYFGTLKFE